MATSHLLCTPSSSIWEHRNLIFGIRATRANVSPDRRDCRGYRRRRLRRRTHRGHGGQLRRQVRRRRDQPICRRSRHSDWSSSAVCAAGCWLPGGPVRRSIPSGRRRLPVRAPGLCATGSAISSNAFRPIHGSPPSASASAISPNACGPVHGTEPVHGTAASLHGSDAASANVALNLVGGIKRGDAQRPSLPYSHYCGMPS